MTDTINQVREAATFLLERLDDFDRAGDNMTEDGQRDWYGHVLPALSRVRTALSRPAPDVPSADEEAYNIGARDGYEAAVQDMDIMTGGDGEFVAVLGCQDDERHCPDVDAMKARIALRFKRPAPDVPSADEVEAIRARHEADCGFESDGMDNAEWRAALTMLATRAHTDRASLLALLDAARAELAEERAKVERLTDALDEIAAHYNGGITGPGRQQADSMRNIARAALAKDAPDPLGDGQ
jgi:hypothetical protein